MKKLYTSVNLLKKIAFILLSIVISRTSIAQNAGCHAGFTFVVSGNTVTFNDTSFFDVGPQNTTWFWDFGDGSTDASQSPVHTFSTPPDQFTVCLAVSNCVILPGTCCTDTVCRVIQFGKSTGIMQSSMTGDNVVIFPNPAQGNFSLSFNLSENSTVVLQITDATGRICHLSEAMNFSTGNQNINFNETVLPSKGIYFLRIIADAKPLSVSKLIKL